MENLLGFIVFLAIVIISIINKVVTESKAAKKEQEQRDRPISVDEIPEATRRMLYGDGADIMVAKPRRDSSERRAAPTRPHPVTAREVKVEQGQPQQPPRPFVQPQPTTRPEPQPKPFVQTPQPTRPATPPMRQPMPQTLRQPAPQTRPRRKPYSAPTPSHVRAESARRAPARTAPKMRTQPVAAETAGTGLNLLAMLASKDDLARGILLREILGPTKAFEDLV